MKCVPESENAYYENCEKANTNNANGYCNLCKENYYKVDLYDSITSSSPAVKGQCVI